MKRPRSANVSHSHPPVVEVAMSVQFDPPSNLTLAHLGAFWATQKENFPKVRATQPIAASNEDFESEGPWLPPSLRLAFIDEPQCRLQMTSADEQWMCQFQPDRLVVNWRKKSEDYPRFEKTLERFQASWHRLQEFFADEAISAPEPRLWEVTYVNRIPKGDLWQCPADWPQVFPGLWGNEFSSADGLSLRGLRGQWVWDYAPGHARLYVEPSPARSADNPPVELLMLNLTARGPIKSKGDCGETMDSIDAIESGMNLGHDLIVSTFDQISSTQAKVHWGRHGEC